jgi:hypothetical protein
MPRRLLALVLLLAVACPVSRSQAPAPKAPLPRSLAAVGAHVNTVPEILYEHVQLPSLRRGLGVVVECVTPNTPAAAAGLQRHDVLISCSGRPILDGPHFLRLLQGSGDRKVPILLIRGGREMTLNVTLPSQTALNSSPPEMAKGLLKPGGPPAVDVEAEPLADGKLRVTFTYYSEGKGKLERLTCSGSLDEIQGQVRGHEGQNDIPPRVLELVDVALRRLRLLNAQ